VILASPSSLHALDETVFRAIYAGPSGGSWFLFMLALSFTTLGGGWAMLALVPLLIVRRSRKASATLAGTLLGTAITVFALKAVTGRVRPCRALEGVVASVAEPLDYSFPSGHAAGSFTVAAFVATLMIARHRRTHPHDRHPWAFAIVSSSTATLFASASSVALSRVYLGVHFPFDTVAGALLGTVFGTFGGFVYLSRSRRVASCRVVINARATPPEGASHPQSDRSEP
jgi:membrane-associated phospholipid phosphatase